MWFATHYGADVTGGWPELRQGRLAKLGADRTAAQLRVGHAQTVTEAGLAIVPDGRPRGGGAGW